MGGQAGNIRATAGPLEPRGYVLYILYNVHAPAMHSYGGLDSGEVCIPHVQHTCVPCGLGLGLQLLAQQCAMPEQCTSAGERVRQFDTWPAEIEPLYSLPR